MKLLRLFFSLILLVSLENRLYSMENLWSWIKERTIGKAEKNVVILMPYHGDRFLFEKTITEEFRTETKTVLVARKSVVERGGSTEETYEEQESDGYEEVEEVTDFYDSIAGEWKSATTYTKVPRYKTVTKTRCVPSTELEEVEELVPEEIEAGKTLIGKETTVRFFAQEASAGDEKSIDATLKALVKEVSKDLNSSNAQKIADAAVKYKRLMMFEASDKLHIFKLDVGSDAALDNLQALDKERRIILTGKRILEGDLPSTFAPLKDTTSLGIYFGNLMPIPQVASLLSAGKVILKSPEGMSVDLLRQMTMLNKNLQNLLAHIEAFTKKAR